MIICYYKRVFITESGIRDYLITSNHYIFGKLKFSCVKWFFKFSRDSDLTFLMDYKRESESAGICILISLKIHIRNKKGA